MATFLSVSSICGVTLFLIFSTVESFKEIQDSLCVSQRSKDGLDERVILFLKMAQGSELGPPVIQSLRTHIR